MSGPAAYLTVKALALTAAGTATPATTRVPARPVGDHDPPDATRARDRSLAAWKRAAGAVRHPGPARRRRRRSRRAAPAG